MQIFLNAYRKQASRIVKIPETKKDNYTKQGL